MRLRWPATRRGPIGLDIGDRWIKAIQLDGDGTRIQAAASIARHASPDADIPTLTHDEARRLVTILRRRGFLGRRTVLAVPARAVMTSILELPPPDSGAPVTEIARVELAEAHRREPEQMEVACWAIPRPARPVQGIPAMAVGCTHADADDLIDPLEEAGLCVEAFDMQGWAVTRICTRRTNPAPSSTTEKEDGSNSQMMAALDLGWSAAALMLLHRNTVVYERSLPTAGLRHLAAALHRSFTFKPDVIEYLLRDLGMGPGSGSSDDEQLHRKTRGHFETHFETLIKELRLSISYAQHQYPQTAVGSIIVTGGGGGVPGLTDHLISHVDVPVETLAPADALGCNESLTVDAASPAMTIAAGLALWEEKGATQWAA